MKLRGLAKPLSLMHLRPKGFHRIRHYGFLANGNRAANVARARHFLALPSHPDPQSPEKSAEPSPRVVPGVRKTCTNPDIRARFQRHGFSQL